MKNILSDDVAFYYERLVCNAFNCKKSKYSFATKEFCLNSKKYHKKALAAFLQSAIILLAKRNEEYSDILNNYIELLDSDLTYQRAKKILIDMHYKNIVLE